MMATLWFKPILAQVMSKLTFGVVDHEWDRTIYITVASLQLHFIQAVWKPMPNVLYGRFQPPQNSDFMSRVANGMGDSLFTSQIIDG